jgi:hypothetical protein
MTRPLTALLSLLLTGAFLAVASPAAAQSGDPAPGSSTTSTPATVPTTNPAPSGVQQISDERVSTFWAHSAGDDIVHFIPTDRGREVARLHLLTEDGAAEVYVVLRRYVDGAGRTWLRIRVPRRPNGTTGWVLATSLGPIHRISTHLVIDRGHLRAFLYNAGRVVWSSPVGVGKASTPTPRGNFWIREKLVALGGSDPIYGPYALGTSAYSVLTDWPGGGVVGIHGTNQPQLIPGRPSHGCVRIPNPAVTRLYHLIPVGTPVTIL